MRIAYVNYGPQSGVTASVLRGLSELGHHLEIVDPTHVLALRDAHTGRPRPTPQVMMHFASSLWHYGRRAVDYRWNTPFAFDTHSRSAGDILARLEPAPDVILQAGTLFSPGLTPRAPYVLLLDNTCALTARQPRIAGEEPNRFSPEWFERERGVMLGADGIAAFSEATRESCIRDYGVSPARVHVVGAGVNVVPAEQPAREDDGHTILFIGKGVFRHKGGPLLLEAFGRLRARDPRARLVLIGPNEPVPQLPGVENLGLLPFDEVARHLERATIFVLPTLRDPFGIAFLDAMAHGVPCIGTSIGAVPEILDHGRAGVLVPPNDVDALASAIESLLADPARRAALGEAGRRRVRGGGYTWPEVTRRLAAVLGSVARRRSVA